MGECTTFFMNYPDKIQDFFFLTMLNIQFEIFIQNYLHLSKHMTYWQPDAIMAYKRGTEVYAGLALDVKSVFCQLI